jgi:digeranylgeranylglycerophospholipid reductase
MDCDVLVVGAGPAGCAAAFFLKYFDKDNELNVTLVERLDKKKYNIYHRICGEGVSEDCFRDVAPIKPSAIVERIKCLRDLWPGKIENIMKTNGYILNRAQFLENITDQYRGMGGNFKLENVSNFSQSKDKVAVKFSGGKVRKFSYVIAADGANSVFRKMLRIRGGGVIPVIQYIIDEEPVHDTLFFYYDEKYKGDYSWIFPNGSTKKVGFPLIKNFAYPSKFLAKQTRVIGYGGIDKFVSGRILLVGDAACQTNALTKGGIRSGMNAAKMAAEAVVNGNSNEYEKKWIQSPYASPLFNEAFERLRDMDNQELNHHIKPFAGEYGIKSYFISRLLYRKYIGVYKAYEMSDIGW